jgi:hypothetical protein
VRHAGWGVTLEQRTRCEEPLGGQLQLWTTFFYYRCSRNRLADHYVGDTVRADFHHGAIIVSACRRNRFVKVLERLFPGFLFYGRRELLEIHVRR